MKLRELIRQTDVIDNASVFAGATRGWTTDAPEIYLAIRDSSNSALYSMDLTREAAQKLIDELTAALALPALTPEEVANHREHQAWVMEKERGW